MMKVVFETQGAKLAEFKDWTPEISRFLKNVKKRLQYISSY